MSNFNKVHFDDDDDDVHFVLDQHAELDIYSASSLKQQPAGRHVAPPGHIILIPRQAVFTLTLLCCVLSREPTNTNFIVFCLTQPWLEPRSTTLAASMLTITPPMWFIPVSHTKALKLQ